MSPNISVPPLDASAIEGRFNNALRNLRGDTDRFFIKLLLFEWVGGIILALLVTPLTWSGRDAQLHPHVIAAVFFGAMIVGYPVWLGLKRPGEPMTRHLLAIAQMLMSALYIHLTGGRIETHFHVFGSLAFLSFYRDIRVLITATVVVYADHLLRGIFWPESVYGIFVASPWRSIEHAGWVLFEVIFLALAIRRSLAEMHQVAQRQVSLEDINEAMEAAVQERTTELRRSEERYRALYQNSPVGLYQADITGKLLVANPTLVSMLGYHTEEELIGANARLWNSDYLIERERLYQDLQLKGEIHGRDTRWRHRNGETVFVLESVKIDPHEKADTLRVEASVENVTERRQLEMRYLQSQKVQAIGQLAGGVAHDFNNLLTAILGYTDMIETKHLAPGAEVPLDQIRRAADRAAGLTQQLLAFSRKQTLQPRVIQLNSVISDLNAMLHRIVGETIQIRMDADKNLFLVKADPGQIQQVLLNLVVNARDAMPNGGQITIGTANLILDEENSTFHPGIAHGEYAMFWVLDSGGGIPPEVMSHIFEPFFTTKEVGKGTGLGLATCHGIIKQSGGHITVTSEVGQGTVFRIYLPRSVEHGEALLHSESQPGEVQRGHETILFVEDEPFVREIGVQALTSLGYQVIEAANGLEALQRFTELRGQKIHLVITDVVMPKMGGRELAHRLRELSPRLRILFSSGYSYDTIEQTDLLEDGIFFLQKPYTMTGIGRKVREVLETRVSGFPSQEEQSSAA